MTDIKIIANSPKYKTIDSIINDLSDNSVLLKENVRNILRSNGIISDHFDDYFNAGFQKLQKSLNKRYLKGIRRVLSCENVENALKLIIQKLTSNTRNEMNPKRSNSIQKEIELFQKNEYLNQAEEIENQELIIDDLRKVAKEYPRKMEIELEDSGFCHDDIRDLCLKIGIDFETLDLEHRVESESEKLENSDLVQLMMLF